MPQKQQDGCWPFGFWSLKDVMKRAKFQKVFSSFVSFLKKVNAIEKRDTFNLNELPNLYATKK